MSATRKNLRDQVLRVLLGGPAYGSQIVERLPDEDPAGVRSAVRRLLRDHAIARGSDKRLSIALTVDDLRDLNARLDACETEAEIDAFRAGVLGGLWAGFNAGSRVFGETLPAPEPGHDWYALPAAEVQRLLPRPPPAPGESAVPPNPLFAPARLAGRAASATWSLAGEFAVGIVEGDIATERVKKPEVCIDLWNEVITNDPENAEALNALSGLHERAKDWAALAAVLQKQVDSTFDAKAKEVLLGKLGALYGERLNDDEAAVEAWRQLLVLNPQERKAQEALKKKYLTLGRWDDLEVFYAESGKWDEFIRVLESQEAKETDERAKIGLLIKIAQLWMVQKGKPDRAAKAYEKVLDRKSVV